LGKINNIFGSCEYDFEKEYVHIYNLYIDPDYRRQGKATRLLLEIIKEIRMSGYNGEISIVTNNFFLKEFYSKFGLRVFDFYG